MPDRTEIVTWFKLLQDQICRDMETMDGEGKFIEDNWIRPEGGGGRSRVINGRHIEKGGVMFSYVHGEIPTSIAKGLEMKPGKFHATGVSIVLHPKNPWVPIIHMNVRYFETEEKKWWFGGGIDVTPHYINSEEAVVFHRKLARICGQLGDDTYEEYKSWADDYFFNQHRNETRGIGGIFFDRLGDDTKYSKQDCWKFVKNVGSSFTDCYKGFFERNFMRSFDEREILWQHLRRSRYVEFNLVYDRGTKFGLQTGGRIESILMSMPPTAKWVYNHVPEDGSPEAHTATMLKKGIDWVNYKEV